MRLTILPKFKNLGFTSPSIHDYLDITCGGNRIRTYGPDYSDQLLSRQPLSSTQAYLQFEKKKIEMVATYLLNSARDSNSYTFSRKLSPINLQESFSHFHFRQFILLCLGDLWVTIPLPSEPQSDALPFELKSPY